MKYLNTKLKTGFLFIYLLIKLNVFVELVFYVLFIGLSIHIWIYYIHFVGYFSTRFLLLSDIFGWFFFGFILFIFGF
jgi:hypothetical protein